VRHVPDEACDENGHCPPDGKPGRRGLRGPKGSSGVQGLPGVAGLSVAYVVSVDCIKKHEKIDLALFGADGRGGIVKDLQEIKTATSALRSIILPVAISIASALITAAILLSLKSVS